MIKKDKNCNSISCNTRLKYQFNKEQSRFTASDIEIFTDLNELKKLSQTIDRNIISTEEIEILPQKRKKSPKVSPKNPPETEDEVISVLASLFHQNHQSQHAFPPQKFESNLKELIKAVFSQPSQPLDQKFKTCRSSVKVNKKGTNIKRASKSRSRAALRLFE